MVVFFCFQISSITINSVIRGFLSISECKLLNYWNLLTVKQNLISSHTCEKIWCVSSWNRLQFPNEIIVIMTTVVCLEAEDDLLLMMAIFHIKGLAIGVSLKLIFRFMRGCFGDINKMDGHIARIFNSRRCSSGYKRTSLLKVLLWNTLETVTDRFSDFAEQT